MPDNETDINTKTEAYKERDDFVPETYAYLGTVDTTGTGGDLAGQVTQSSPVHEKLRAEALAFAAENPDDANVILPDEDLDRDQAIDAIKSAAKDAAEVAADQAEGGYLTPAQREAAMEGTPVNPYSPEALRDDTLPVDESNGEATPVEPRTGVDGGLRQDESENPNPRSPIGANGPDDPNQTDFGLLGQGSASDTTGGANSLGGSSDSSDDSRSDDGDNDSVGQTSDSTPTPATVFGSGSSDQSDATTTPGTTGTVDPADDERPSQAAPVTEWRSWAVKHKGLSEAEAKQKSKTDLQKL